MKFDWLIVGAGYSGAVLAERIASQRSQKVMVIDSRDHIAGNAYDEVNEAGILVHKYGPHIFHTNSDRVWNYLSQFTGWRPYEHRVLGAVQGKLVSIPFNLNSLDALFSPIVSQRLEKLLIEAYGRDANVPVLKLREHSDADIRGLAEFVYDNVFKNYTIKQWNLKPEQLDPSVTARVPVVIGRDDRYFHDTFQAMPDAGYTAMFSRMLAHPNITLALGVNSNDAIEDVEFNRMIFTGPIDEFFGNIHGPLPYRSLRFEFETLEQEFFQSAGTINYPNDYNFTRITEQKYLTGQRSARTTVVREYPQEHIPGRTIPYYPIPRDENREIYRKYQMEAQKAGSSVLFCGRLADYKYYNMDQAVASALSLFQSILDEG
jgi:UDP-galactopyranose mutase